MKDACLVVVDVQNDFIPGGALAVPRGDEVVPVINRLAARFENVILTQDWHPRGHASFASSHAGKKPFETIDLPYGGQVLWPDHCVQGTPGAAFQRDLDASKAQLVRAPDSPATCASEAWRSSTSAASPPTSASPGPRSTAGRPDSTCTSSRTPAARSISKARSSAWRELAAAGVERVASASL